MRALALLAMAVSVLLAQPELLKHLLRDRFRTVVPTEAKDFQACELVIA